MTEAERCWRLRSLIESNFNSCSMKNVEMYKTRAELQADRQKRKVETRVRRHRISGVEIQQQLRTGELWRAQSTKLTTFSWAHVRFVFGLWSFTGFNSVILSGRPYFLFECLQFLAVIECVFAYLEKPFSVFEDLIGFYWNFASSWYLGRSE